MPGYKKHRTLVRSGAPWITVPYLCQCPQSCQFMGAFEPKPVLTWCM